MTNDQMTKGANAPQASSFGLRHSFGFRHSDFVIPASRRHRVFKRRNTETGSVLIIVMVICLGLVSVALYFGHSSAMAYRASSSDLAGRQAQRAIDGAAQYAEYLMLVSGSNITPSGGSSGSGATSSTSSTTTNSGSYPPVYLLPQASTYQAEAVPVEDATFWFIGDPETTNSGSVGSASTGPSNSNVPVFGLVDEASKLNLNTASVQMLAGLPNMTPSLAQAIVAWRKTSTSGTSGSTSSSSSSSTSNGSSTTISKGGPFESIYELAQVAQADGDDPSILYGNDTNLNHVMDGSESMSQGAAQFTPGIYNYVTVYSREPNIVPGTTQPRISVTTGSSAVSSGSSSSSSTTSTTSSGTSTPTTLNALLTQMLGQNRAQEIRSNVLTSLLQVAGLTGTAQGGGRGGGGGGGAVASSGTVNSVLEFYIRGKLTPAELDELTPYLTSGTSKGNYTKGLINVNTASAEVLACVPGFTTSTAQQVVTTRQGQTTPYTNLAWIATILGNTASYQAGPYLTTESFQVSADVAAVGPGGLGYRRTQFVIDGSNGAPQIVYRHDMTPLGWALGPQALQSLQSIGGKTKTTIP